MGGPSSEHEVSLNTGKEIVKHLDRHKYNIGSIVIPKKGSWFFPKPIASGVIVFIAMHGEFGEDGTVQGLLESRGIPYTGSGILASALGMDKPRQAALFHQAGLKVPEFIVLQKSDWRKNKKRIAADMAKNFSMPCVVKPANRGSSVGVSIVKSGKELAGAIQFAFFYADLVMVQKFIRGREVTCGIVEGRGGVLLPLPPIEILAKAGKFYDYKSKYSDGGSEHIIPPKNMLKSTIKKIQDAACLTHHVLGCRGMSRTDFILQNNGALHILEINTLPGMTSTSLLPESARAAGIVFPMLLNLIIKSALRKRRPAPYQR